MSNEVFTEKVKEKLISKLTCRICLGIFRNPMTSVECMHTFCNACLLKRFEQTKTCPTCKIDLGGDPQKKLTADTIIQGLIDILLPEFKQLNKENCIHLYEVFRKNSQSLPGEVEALKDILKDDYVFIELLPMNPDNQSLKLSPLKISCIKVTMSCTIKELQKYIALKLSIPNPDDIAVLYKNQITNQHLDLIRLKCFDTTNIFHYMKKE